MILIGNKELKQDDFKNEKELQKYFENNLEQILGFKFICTEFTVGNFRVDSLAFDAESKSFKIIEYKNVKNHSLVDQGYTYLKLLLERKADFVLQYNTITKSALTINDIDWSQSRIIFVSPTFTPYQLNATDFKNIPVDLIKVTKYENNIIDIDFIKKTSNVKIEEFGIENEQREVSKEIKVYTEEDHLNKVSEGTQKLYELIKSKILELDDIDIDVKKVYDNGTEALKGISFAIEDGEFAFLVGPSGSGKSTIIKLLTGEIVPTSGRVMVNGFSMGRISDRQIPYMRRTIGVIFQDFRLIMNKTVWDNLSLAMRAVGASPKEIKNRIPYVLELVGLKGKEQNYPDQLSGGEQQRVAIARALVNNPSTIVADEPTGNLDPNRSLEIMTLLERINALGTTVVVVTHERGLVNHFDKRVITINDGIVAGDGMGQYEVAR